MFTNYDYDFKFLMIYIIISPAKIYINDFFKKYSLIPIVFFYIIYSSNS